ncbi:YoaK family protein [Actinophytocola sp.]|uniref:YoaK family protein n=1 Tax=Actinophytocola sp. TaxID=1872138 RepID=UPI002EDB05A7
MDRGAAHVAPVLLVVRDRLLVALAFASGIYEAICFLSFGKVFSGFQTGNIVFLGVGAAGTRPPAGPNPVTVLVSLAAFAVGAALSMWILKPFNGDEEVEDSEVLQVWPRRVSATLWAVLVLQVGFLVVWMVTSPSAMTYLLIGLNACAMGMQMNAVRSLHVPGISTTAASATFISLTSGIATWSLKAHPARRLTGVLVAMAAGALIGDWTLSHAHPYAPVLPVLVIAAVNVIASTSLRRAAAR